MNQTKFIVVLALLLTACTTAQPIVTQDGKEGFAISCGGTANDWASCYEKAGQSCGGKGYNVLDKLQTTTMDTASRTMVIACKE